MKKLPNRGTASYKPSSMAICFVSPQQKLRDDQQKTIHKLCRSCEDLHKTFTLVQSFRKMMDERSGNTELRDWLEKSNTSGIKEIVSFAKGLLADYPAVENALTLTWGNGTVEGNDKTADVW